MRIMTFIAALAGIAAPVAPAAETAPRSKKPMRDAATHDQIADVARKAAEEKKTVVFTPPTDAQQKVEKQRQEPRSLLAISDVICFNGLATMVPKRAVLHVPKNLADRIGMKEGARFVSFQDFITGNRAWLTNSPVSRVQAEGNEPLSEATLKSFEKETRMVIATFHEGPISVLPLKVPVAPTVATP